MRKAAIVLKIGLLTFAIIQSSCNDEDKPLPVIETIDVTEITLTTAKSGGNISTDGGSEITARGVCWDVNPKPTIADSKSVNGLGVGNFESSVSDLNPSTTYFLRAYVTSNNGTAYGNENTFTTLTPLYTSGAGVTDIDGNIYSTIKLGTQEWMAQNLKTTKYSNGDPITNAIDNGSWGAVMTGAWCYYNNDTQFNPTFGKLYNWYAVADSRNVCPNGYHIPSTSEWATLETLLGGSNQAGGKMKEEGTSHWASPNNGADNTSGFTAVPGGDRRPNGLFEVMTILSRNWTSSQLDVDAAYGRDIAHDQTNVGSVTLNKNYGFAVRCLKN